MTYLIITFFEWFSLSDWIVVSVHLLFANKFLGHVQRLPASQQRHEDHDSQERKPSCPKSAIMYYENAADGPECGGASGLQSATTKKRACHSTFSQLQLDTHSS